MAEQPVKAAKAECEIAPPPAVRDILAALSAAGAQGFVVGGCVRDSLLGLPPRDWDLCTDAPPERVREILGGRWRILDTGLKHGTVTALAPAGAGAAGESAAGAGPATPPPTAPPPTGQAQTGEAAAESPQAAPSAPRESYEITTFRSEGPYSDGRRPDTVRFVRSIEEDLARRDLTINAMAWSEATGLVDPFGGRADLAAGILRCVGRPEARFAEDALRILRTARFAARYGFAVEPATRAAMRSEAARLAAVSAERTGAELRQLLCAPFAARAVAEHKEVLCEVVPELRPLIGCGQNSRYHRADVFGHTLLAMEAAGRCSEFPTAWADEPVRIALFFHDFGKPAVKTTGEDGRDHFYGHPAVSAELAGAILRRLRFSSAEVGCITELVRYHDVEYLPQTARVRRLLAKFGPEQLHRLLKIRECDNAAHSALAREKFEAEVLPFAALLEQVLAEQSALSRADLAVTGKDLIGLGVRPGPQVGRMLQSLLDAVLEERLPNQREALLAAAKALQNEAASS